MTSQAQVEEVTGLFTLWFLTSQSPDGKQGYIFDHKASSSAG